MSSKAHLEETIDSLITDTKHLEDQLAAARAETERWKKTHQDWVDAEIPLRDNYYNEIQVLKSERDTAYAKAREDAAKVVEGYDLKMTQLVWASERPDDFVMKCLAHIATAIRNLP